MSFSDRLVATLVPPLVRFALLTVKIVVELGAAIAASRFIATLYVEVVGAPVTILTASQFGDTIASVVAILFVIKGWCWSISEARYKAGNTDDAE